MDGDKDKEGEGWREREARRLEHEAREMEGEAHRLEEEAHRLEEDAHRLEDEARREEEDHGHDRHRAVAITVVILNGPSPVVEAHLGKTLREVVIDALAESENVGQKPEGWQLKTLEGNLFDLERTVGSYDFGREVTVYLSLRAGEAGEANLPIEPGAVAEGGVDGGRTGSAKEIPEVSAGVPHGLGVVDPRISRAKFDEEVALFRSRAKDGFARGVMLLDATYPKAFVAFAAVRLKPAPIVCAVEIDFSDYDYRPPSVRFVDPFTRRVLTYGELTMHMFRRQGDLPPPAVGILPVQVPLQPLIQAHAVGDVPFLCLPGIREYHDNPGHSGDSWFLHRGGVEGTLAFILEAIWAYGSNTIENYQVGLQTPAVGFAANPASIPA